jgi:hypothetical protein
MAFTLAEMSKIEKDTLRKSVMDTLLMESDVLQIIPWETIGQMATTITRYQSTPDITFRKINEGYSEGNVALEQVVETVSLMGVYLDTDRVIARAKNTIGDARAISQTMGLKGIAYTFNDKFINGDPASDPDEFKGLLERIEDLRDEGFTGQYISNAGTSGDGILLNATERQNFLDSMDKAIYAIKGHNPGMAFMNQKMLLALRSLLRREGLLDTTKDQFDRVVNMYQDVQLQDIGVKADQTTEIITSTETLEAAGSAESTSIYFAKFGVGEFFWGLQQYPIEVEDLGRLEAKPVFRTEIDWPLTLAQADPYAISRLYGIIPDASS